MNLAEPEDDFVFVDGYYEKTIPQDQLVIVFPDDEGDYNYSGHRLYTVATLICSEFLLVHKVEKSFLFA